MSNRFVFSCQSTTPRKGGRGGFSLVELLVASMLTLLIMGAVATLFGEFGKSVADGRANSALGARTRNVAMRLREDFAGLTCVPVPFMRMEASAGYFFVNGTSNATDVLALTTTSSGAPFRGQLQGAQGFESPTAEVVWFTMPDTVFKGRQLYSLYRRQLLVSASPGAGVYASSCFADPGQSDLSTRPVPSYAPLRLPNGLSDLTNPVNRLVATPQAQWVLTGNREGQDLILRNVLSFNVKIGKQLTNPRPSPNPGGGPWLPWQPPLPRPPLPPPLPYQYEYEFTRNTYPSCPPIDFEDTTFDTSPSGNPAAPPLRSIEVTITCLEPTTNEERVIEVVHSFGQDRNPIPE